MSVRLLADENLRRAIVVGLQREVESVDIVRVQDVGLRTADDPAVLEWAAEHGRSLVTHDIRTVPDFAYERVAAGLSLPGVFVVRSSLPVAVAIKELAMVVVASDDGDWVGQVIYLPLP